jgi:hypothetical protein
MNGQKVKKLSHLTHYKHTRFDRQSAQKDISQNFSCHLPQSNCLILFHVCGRLRGITNDSSKTKFQKEEETDAKR